MTEITKADLADLYDAMIESFETARTAWAAFGAGSDKSTLASMDAKIADRRASKAKADYNLALDKYVEQPSRE